MAVTKLSLCDSFKFHHFQHKIDVMSNDHTSKVNFYYIGVQYIHVFEQLLVLANKIK